MSFVIFDVVILILLLLTAWKGYRRGFVLTLCSLLAVFVAFIGATVISSQLARPMSRLIQGDVGSGKTAVAAGVAYTVVKNGWQAAMMAPTEILAEQHARSLSGLLEPGGVRVGLLTGSMPAAEKRDNSLRSRPRAKRGTKAAALRRKRVGAPLRACVG